MGAVEQLRRLADERKTQGEVVLALLDHAFVIHDDDLALGPERLAELSTEQVEAAAQLVEDQVPAAVDDAKRLLVDAVLAMDRDRARLAPGWDDELGVMTDFYAKQVAERVEEARQRWVAELQRMSDEAESMGWDDATLHAVLDVEVNRPGKHYGAFRTALREAVSTVVGEAWTETWLAAWAALEVTSELLDESRMA